MAAEIGGDGWVIDEAGDAKVWLGGADGIDHGPEAAGVLWAVRVAGEEGGAIGMGEGDAEVETEDRGGRGFLRQPRQHLGAGPAVAGADEVWRGGAIGA